MGARSSKKYNVTTQQGATPASEQHSPTGAEAAADVGTSKESDAKKNVPADSSGDIAAGENSNDQIESVLCKTDELQDGEMKEFEIEGKKVLLVKKGQDFFAVGSKCTHYGAPLSKGVYCNGFVRCPWHGACFSVETGDIEDFPGLDSLPTFEVKLDENDNSVKIISSRAELTKTKRTRDMCKFNPESEPESSVVVIGGGAAAVSCAESLRQEGYAGKIVIVSQEHCLPYDRPKISKGLDIAVENILMRPAEFYEQFGIEIMTGVSAVKVDSVQRKVELSDGRELTYKNLVVATGGKPRQLTCPGAELENVTYFRVPEDGAQIGKFAPGRNVVVIGSSFIGMEAASILSKREAKSISCIDCRSTPFELTLGKEVGAALQQLHESNGVKFYLGSGVKELRGVDGILSEVVLNDDTVLPADLCVVGIGVVPATDFLQDSGLEIDEGGFLPVNECMRTNLENVYACGDIAKFPLSSSGNQVCNVQHWQIALKHGKVAGLAIAGKAQSIKTVPFFWSVMFGKSLRYAGYGSGYDDVVVKGDLNELKFIAYYLKSNLLVAVATLGRDPVAAQIADCFRLGNKITRGDVEQNESDNWGFLLK